jgi:hypothetical protein
MITFYASLELKLIILRKLGLMIKINLKVEQALRNYLGII